MQIGRIKEIDTIHSLPESSNTSAASSTMQNTLKGSQLNKRFKTTILHFVLCDLTSDRKLLILWRESGLFFAPAWNFWLTSEINYCQLFSIIIYVVLGPSCGPSCSYPEVAADERVDAGDDKKGEDELEHRAEYCVPEYHNNR